MRVTEQTKTATRRRILEASQKLFTSQGFEAATTRDIARAAEIATGTLFNYFPTKESIALCLIGEAHGKAEEQFQVSLLRDSDEKLSLEEELFAHVASGLRKLKPYRKYLNAVLEAAMSPLAIDQGENTPGLRAIHLETVSQIALRHDLQDALSAVALHLYWTLYIGVLAFWSKDTSPRQEDTLALLDQSLAMFAGWLTTHAGSTATQERQR